MYSKIQLKIQPPTIRVINYRQKIISRFLFQPILATQVRALNNLHRALINLFEQMFQLPAINVRFPYLRFSYLYFRSGSRKTLVNVFRKSIRSGRAGVKVAFGFDLLADTWRECCVRVLVCGNSPSKDNLMVMLPQLSAQKSSISKLLNISR